MVVENDEEILKSRSQEYSVFLTDKMNSTSGSGILYYSGVGEYCLDFLLVPTS